MQSAGTRLSPVTAATGSAHARGRKERSAGGAAAGGGRQKTRLPHHGLRRTEGRGEWGSAKVATHSRCCTERPRNTRLEVTEMTHTHKSRCEV